MQAGANRQTRKRVCSQARLQGIHGSPFRGKVPGAGTPRHSLVTVRSRRGQRRDALRRNVPMPPVHRRTCSGWFHACPDPRGPPWYIFGPPWDWADLVRPAVRLTPAAAWVRPAAVSLRLRSSLTSLVARSIDAHPLGVPSPCDLWVRVFGFLRISLGRSRGFTSFSPADLDARIKESQCLCGSERWCVMSQNGVKSENKANGVSEVTDSTGLMAVSLRPG
jgi:hypothetical protein